MQFQEGFSLTTIYIYPTSPTSVRGTVPPLLSSILRLLCISCHYEDSEDLSYFSRENSIREAVATSSKAMGKMKGTTSGANDALADFPKLLQEGGTDSRLQCGSRSSLSVRSAADRNSYASGATWRSPSSLSDCQGKRNSPGPESRPRVSLKQERSHYALPITLSTIQGRVRTEDTS